MTILPNGLAYTTPAPRPTPSAPAPDVERLETRIAALTARVRRL
jgi:hypothetical protein